MGKEFYWHTTDDSMCGFSDETVAQEFYRDEKHSQSPQLTPDAEGFSDAFSQHATAVQIALSAAVQGQSQ